DHRAAAAVDAEVGFEPPDRDQDRPRHAEPLLDAREQAGVLRHQPPRLGDARIDSRQRELLEGLPEHALPPVERDHLRIGREAGEGLCKCAWGDSLRRRLAREGGDEGRKVTATGRGGCRRGNARDDGSENQAAHDAYLSAIIATFEWPPRPCGGKGATASPPLPSPRSWP